MSDSNNQDFEDFPPIDPAELQNINSQFNQDFTNGFSNDISQDFTQSQPDSNQSQSQDQPIPNQFPPQPHSTFITVPQFNPFSTTPPTNFFGPPVDLSTPTSSPSPPPLTSPIQHHVQIPINRTPSPFNAPDPDIIDLSSFSNLPTHETTNPNPNLDGLELSDMIANYNSIFTPDIQTEIGSKREFAELASSFTEKPIPGHYFRHQRFVHRFMTEYQSLLSISEPGTGKSLEVIPFFMMCLREHEKSKIDPLSANEKIANIKQVYILVNGPTQKEELIKQIVCKGSEGQFITPLVLRSTKQSIQKRHISIALKAAGITIITYEKFYRNLAKRPYSDDNRNLNLVEIVKLFSDTFFWLDEVHNITYDPKSQRNYKMKTDIYNTIHTVLHVALRIKYILTTATPMINNENELGPLLNLLLPMNGMVPEGFDYISAPEKDIRTFFPGLRDRSIDEIRRMSIIELDEWFVGQIPSTFNFRDATAEELEPYLRGRINYVRAADTGVDLTRVGLRSDVDMSVNGVSFRSQLVLYAHQMSDFQTEAYLRAQQQSRGTSGGRSSPFISVREASNFVFPDGSWGGGATEEDKIKGQQQQTTTEQGDIIFTPAVASREGKIGFNKYIIKNRDSYAAVGELYDKLYGDDENMNNLRTMSCKFASVVDICLNGVSEEDLELVDLNIIDGDVVGIDREER